MKIGILDPSWAEPFSYLGVVPIFNIEEVDKMDIIVVPGGGDVHPLFYKENDLFPIIRKNIRLDEFEILAIRRAISVGKKVLGVCRGHQIVNVALGGTLIQDISTFGYKNHFLYHNPLIWKEGAGVLSKMFAEVNSMHHQALKNVAESLTVLATSQDGIIEACSGFNGQVVTVQFHPEFLSADYFSYILDTGNLI